jgi:hypothetical protein
MEFVGFPKIARLSREIVVTEKIDGTNAHICIVEQEGHPIPGAIFWKDGLSLLAGSRTRWITPGDDNYGFARWAVNNGEELLQLGPGSHFGEWWGQGIQRNYGLKEKRFSLFNVGRWNIENRPPEICHVVPTLYTGIFNTMTVHNVLGELGEFGSEAAPGFMRPEGIIIYHSAARTMFKKTIEKDDQPKGL